VCSLNLDQRKVRRPQGPACDIGSYEANYPLALIDILPGSPVNVVYIQQEQAVALAVPDILKDWLFYRSLFWGQMVELNLLCRG
jgi:hypothetical protein